MGRVAARTCPCLAIMNMPPLPYLKRIPGLSTDALVACYADPGVWEGFDPGLTTLASPDPQAFRPPDQPKNVLQVGLPTNFKAARFDAEQPTALLRNLENDIEAARFDTGDGTIEIPVKLKVHDSIFVPLAKWPMLMAGNYRCIRRDDMIPIKDAVHGNVEKSREIYNWVGKALHRTWRPGRRPRSFSRSTHRPPKALANLRRLRALFSAGQSTSNASIVWCGASPDNKGCSPTLWTRSSHSWTSVSSRTEPHADRCRRGLKQRIALLAGNRAFTNRYSVNTAVAASATCSS